MFSMIVDRGGSNRKLLYEVAGYNLTPAAADEPVQFDSSSMAVTALVLLSALFFLVFFSVYARRFFSGDQNADNPHRQNLRPNTRLPYRGFPSFTSTAGLDAKAVRALPLLSYSSEGKEQDGCAVCLSAFVEKETLKVIPSCGHVFHPDCIDSWLAGRGSCPLCRCTELFGLSSRGESKPGRDVELGVLQQGSGSGEGQREAKNDLSRVGRSDSWHEPTDSRPSNMTRSHSF